MINKKIILRLLSSFILLTIGFSQLSERPIIYGISDVEDNTYIVRSLINRIIFKGSYSQSELEGRIKVTVFRSSQLKDNFYIAIDKETGLQYFFYKDSLDLFTPLDWKKYE